MVDYEWEADGTWTYAELVDLPPLTVPQPDGSNVPIERLPVHVSKKTLGVWMNPAGDFQKQLDVFHDTLEKWIDRLSVGRLPAKWAWVSYFQQLWAKLKCGLGTNASSAADLEGLS